MDGCEKKYRVGMLDSGVGGISVLACAKRFLPQVDFVYYADTDHVPYGTKPVSEIISYTDSAVRSLTEMGADAVLIACNTATSAAAHIMRERYPLPIIGMEPALKPAAELYPDGKILVCATNATIHGSKLRALIKTTGAHPDLAVTGELVEFAENGVFDSETVAEYLTGKIPDCEKYDAVVLGCTHFTYFRDAFSFAFPKAEIIDGNCGAVRRLASLLGLEMSEKSVESAPTEYLISGRAADEEEKRRLISYEERMTEYYGRE